ncbi:hypothetical protein GF362_01480 [Candidatus Dojkabacteria bacterium]|nr:hypothetical protein [Candidatus Dojkabacteria bacterium]
MKEIIAPNKKTILAKIEVLKNKIEKIINDIDEARSQTTEDDDSLVKGLMDKRDLLTNKLTDLRRALPRLEQSSQQLKSFIIEHKEKGFKKNISIVEPAFTDPGKGLISSKSPLAKALDNKKAGDIIEVETPSGSQVFKVLSD